MSEGLAILRIVRRREKLKRDVAGQNGPSRNGNDGLSKLVPRFYGWTFNHTFTKGETLYQIRDRRNLLPDDDQFWERCVTG